MTGGKGGDIAGADAAVEVGIASADGKAVDKGATGVVRVTSVVEDALLVMHIATIALI